MMYIAKAYWSIGLLMVLLVIAGAFLGWARQPRAYRTDPPVSARLHDYRLMPVGSGGAPPEIYFALRRPYENDSFQLSHGKRLYDWLGCNGCHGDGRGGVGPSFLDGWWTYGPDIVSIVASIREGRPHGMPAFRSRMTAEQIWQLAGYVKAIGTYEVRSAAPGRNDDKHTRPSENRAPATILFEEGPVGGNRDQGASR